MIIKLVLIFVLSYLFGGIPFGYIIGKLHGIDIREHGSCNVGATNVTRLFGKKWGVPCFLMDFIKGFIPIYFVQYYLFSIINISNIPLGLAIVISILGVFLGHTYCIYLRFKGGKGVATCAGAFIAVTPLGILCSLIVWAITYFKTKYVSLASILAAISLAFFSALFSFTGIYKISPKILYFIIIIAIFVIYKHKSNIVKLINGTENRFTKK